jgi:LPXTG-site transpeptidase (sortase) family protein
MFRRVLGAGVCAVLLAAVYGLVTDRLPVPPIARALRAAPMTPNVQAPGAIAPIRLDDTAPARLVIPRIKVDAAVESRGLDSSRNVETPKDYRDVAWYDLGPVPGQPGNALINGHVNWWTGDAVFTSLSALRRGDEITIVQAGGGAVRFRVTGTRTVSADARIASLFAPSATSTLTLITCSGVWNPLAQTDTKRLLVSADLE